MEVWSGRVHPITWRWEGVQTLMFVSWKERRVKDRSAGPSWCSGFELEEKVEDSIGCTSVWDELLPLCIHGCLCRQRRIILCRYENTSLKLMEVRTKGLRRRNPVCVNQNLRRNALFLMQMTIEHINLDSKSASIMDQSKALACHFTFLYFRILICEMEEMPPPFKIVGMERWYKICQAQCLALGSVITVLSSGLGLSFSKGANRERVEAKSSPNSALRGKRREQAAYKSPK